MNVHERSRLDELSSGVQDLWVPSREGAVMAERTSTQRSSARLTCGFAGCAQPWGRFWRRTGRPGFEGQWGCSKVCVQRLVEAAVRREMTDSEASGSQTQHRHRVPLGLVLLAQGWITHPQLQHALAAQRAAGRGRIGDWLVEACGVEQEQVTRGLGVQWNRPVLMPTGFDARSMSLVMPVALREAARAVPLRVAADRLLYLGFEDGVDPAIALALERMTGLQVESGLMGGEDYLRSEVRLREQTAVACTREHADTLDAMALQIARALLSAQPVQSRLVRVRDSYWLRMWLEPAASATGSLLPRSGEDVLDRLYQVGNSARKAQ